MGKKYIIEVEDKPFELLSEDGFTSEKLFRVKGFNSLVFDWNGLNMLTPYTEDSAYAHGYTEAESKYREIRDELEKQAHQRGYEEAYDTAYADAEEIYESGKRAMYQKGLKDAWEAARKIYGSATKHGLPTEVITRIFRDDGKENFNYWDIVEDFSASEAIEEIRQYEQAQKEKEEQEEKDSVTAEEVMRQYLDIFCKSKWCSGCPLNTPDFTCGRGYHFLGSSLISDEEVRRAYATVLQKTEEN